MRRTLSKNTRKELFLILAAPIHFWAVLMFFLNFPKSELRFWTAIGLLSYDMVIAFIDSILLFLIVYLVGVILPKQWDEDKKLLFLGNLGFTIFLGLIFGQFLDSSPLKRWQMWGIVGVISLLFLAFFEYFSLTKKSVAAIHLDFFNRLTFLSYMFLGLDILGLGIIFVRNIFWLRMR